MRAVVREAEDRDLAAIAGIEDASDTLFVERFPGWAPGGSATGEERAAEPGFLLVAGDPPVGFVHVLELEGEAYLEQVSVLPEHGRSGVGAALVEAGCEEAARRGYRRIWLRTFAQVPWNAPFYARHGFAPLEPGDEPAWMAPMRENEQRVGLARLGRRVAMVRRLP